MPGNDHDPAVQNLVDGMVAAERRALAARKRALEDCECRDGMFPNPGRASRRGVLVAAGSAVAAAVAARGAVAQPKVPAGAVARAVADDPTKEPGTPIAEDGGYGSRSQFETAARWR